MTRNAGGRGVLNMPTAIYDLMVRHYVMRGQEQRFRELTADLAGIGPGHTVLDVGCGTGTMAITAKRRVGDDGRVIGIDPSPRLLAGARRKAARSGLAIDFELTGIDRLGLPDDGVDIAIGTFMVHHLPDEIVRNGLRELRRVLKPGGRLLMIDFVRTNEDEANPDRFGAGGYGIDELAVQLGISGFTDVERGDMPLRLRSVARSHGRYGYVRATNAPANIPAA